MSTLVENVAKVTAAHAALKEAIASKGVAVPEGTKLTDMPALVRQISTEPVQTYPRASFSRDKSDRIVVPEMLVVDTIAMTNLDGCFSDCWSLTSLSLPPGFGQAATNISRCFMGCGKLTSLSLPSGFGQAATDLSYCFYDCKKLTSLSLPPGFGQAATSLMQCFLSCSELKSLHLPPGFGQAATSNGYFVGRCYALTTITGNPNFKSSIEFSDCQNLTHDSLMVIINGLQTVTTKQTLTLGSTNLAKLADDEKKVATDKGWTLE